MARGATGKEADCVALIGEAARVFGKADLLVNNAGTNPYFGPLLATPSAGAERLCRRCTA